MHAFGFRLPAFLLALGFLGIGCTQSPERADSRPAGAPSGDVQASVALTPAHVGRRVRAVLKPGTQTVTGTVVEVAPSRDVAMVETEDKHRISIFISQISILEVMPAEEADAHANHRETAAPAPSRMTFAADDPDGGGAVEAQKVQLLFVDFTKTHTCADPKSGCLRDLAGPLEKAPSTVLFVDSTSDAVLRVPIPENEDASLLPFSWHAHVLSVAVDGKPEESKDVLFTQNSDGDIQIKSKDLQGARQLILIGTPYKVKQEALGISAIAPPRMISIDLVEAEKAAALLENNPAIVHSFDTVTGKLYTASQSANDSEMILSIYDPTRKNSEAVPETRFSVQDALLFPAWTLDVTDAAGKHWQRIGAYPVPAYLSHETPDATRITVEIGSQKKGDFPAPAMASVRVPESALVKADLDIHYSGLQNGHTYKMIVANGVPNAKDTTKLFNPISSDVKSEKPYEAVTFDVGGTVADDAFPVQGFVWHQMSTPWKRTGGFMPGATPMKVPDTARAPSRRRAFYPASSPGLKFITFNGPKLSATNASAGVPGALASRGMGGLTIGTGGPYVPFSPAVGTSSVNDNGNSARRPVAMASASPYMRSGPIKVNAAANSNSAAGSTAIAICNGGGGGCDKKDDGKKPGPGQKPVSPNDVPTIDPLARPSSGPAPALPASLGTLSSGGSSYPMTLGSGGLGY